MNLVKIATLASLFTTSLASALPLIPAKPDPESKPMEHLQFVDVLGGKDERFNIPDESGYFTDVGGLLTMKFSRHMSTCTGYLVGAEWILAASHCVYDLKTGEAAREVVFDPALVSPHDFKRPREYASEFWILKDTIELVQSGDALTSKGPTKEYIEKDFALIRIPPLKGRKPLSGYPLHLKVADDRYSTVHMQTAGYPSDKDRGTYWFTSCVGSRDSRYDIIVADCDAVPGQSGSAAVEIWHPEDLRKAEEEGRLNGPVPNKPILIGVISAVSARATYIAALTPDLIEEIHGLIGKTSHRHDSFKKFQLKRNLKHRFFVQNHCAREIPVFVQSQVSENGNATRKLFSMNIPAHSSRFFMDTTFDQVQIFLQPADLKKTSVYRAHEKSWKDPVPLGSAEKIYVEAQREYINGYRFKLGQIWTDSKLILCEE